ncbi:golgin subfamily A member 6-like protein 1 [Pseudomyrmex gracilis]|uniref:golgin subfamily A member 6-like protein 1 n=1 Tax=Pseudomyrmex gracilis TaxID=219809 RepID=UPI000994F45E|nr:golgin subfamily A member 6-like protein 1 [Pseudomyrmex gracilis]
MKDLEVETNRKLEEMRKQIDDIKQEKERKEEVNKLKVIKLEEAVNKMQREIKEKPHCNKQEHESEEGIKENEKLKKDLEWIVEEAERERRKKNIIINSLEIQNKEKLTDWIVQKLEVKVGIRKIWKLKNVEKTIGAQLESKKSKLEIMDKKSKLREEKDKIYINDDLTWKEKQNKKEVFRKRSELEQRDIKCRIGYNKITTEKEAFYWNKKIERWFRKEKREAFPRDIK